MNKSLLAFATGLILSSPMAMGAVSDEDFNALKANFEALANRVEQLAAENSELRQRSQQNAAAVERTRLDVAAVQSEVEETTVAVAEVGSGNESMSWAERISWSGDFRYRYHNDDVDLDSGADRNRNRIRARPALVAKMPSNVEVGFGLATGGDDPVSSNQTLGEGGSSKNINVDLAYFDWTAYDGVHVRGGKFKNKLEIVGKSRLQWDGDWRPEGFDIGWDNGTFFAQGLGNYLESDSARDDEFAYILQAGARTEIGDIKLRGGLGYSDVDAAGRICFFDPADFSGAASTNGCAGNSIITVPGPNQGKYLFDYQVIDVFGEVALKVGELPLLFWGEYVKNDDADDLDTGYQFGTQLGKASKKGSWQIKYYYEDLEADATLGLLTNSDFGGGGTDGKGSVISGAYALSDQTNIKLSYFLVEKQDSLSIANGGTPYDWDTFFLDFNFKYE